MNIKRNKIIFYTTESIKVEFEVHFEDETFWLTQKKMGELFGVEVNTINYHLKEIYKTFFQERFDCYVLFLNSR